MQAVLFNIKIHQPYLLHIMIVVYNISTTKDPQEPTGSPQSSVGRNHRSNSKPKVPSHTTQAQQITPLAWNPYPGPGSRRTAFPLYKQKKRPAQTGQAFFFKVKMLKSLYPSYQ